jgi:hypothetical protein
MSPQKMPFSQVIERERRRWMPRALSKEDQEACDRMFPCPNQQMSAEVQLGRPWSFEAVLVAVLLERATMVGEMARRLEEGSRSPASPTWSIGH